jgi:hypothetical protein
VFLGSGGGAAPMSSGINSCLGHGLVAAPGFESTSVNPGLTLAGAGGGNFALSDIEIYSCQPIQHQSAQVAQTQKGAAQVHAQAKKNKEEQEQMEEEAQEEEEEEEDKEDEEEEEEEETEV